MRDANAWSSESTLRRGREEGTRRFSISEEKRGAERGGIWGWRGGFRVGVESHLEVPSHSSSTVLPVWAMRMSIATSVPPNPLPRVPL